MRNECDPAAAEVELSRNSNRVNMPASSGLTIDPEQTFDTTHRLRLQLKQLSSHSTQSILFPSNHDERQEEERQGRHLLYVKANQ